MTTTQKRITVSLTKEDIRMLNIIREYLGDTTSGSIRRCLISYFQNFIKDIKSHENN